MGVDDVAASPEAKAAPSSSSGAERPNAESEEEAIKRLHILPLKEADAQLKGRSRMEFLAESLRQLRNAKEEFARACDLVKVQDAEFVVIKCDPPEGCLSMETDFFVDGSPVISFQKIQFSAWGPTELSSEQLFNEYVRPYFKGEYAPYGPGAKRVRLLYMGQVVQVGEVCLQVEATEPAGLGAGLYRHGDLRELGHDPRIREGAHSSFSGYASTCLALQRLPEAVPGSKSTQEYQANDFFSYQGVQFKVVACEPEAVARIGKGTTIFCEGHLNPSLRNLLPPNLMPADASAEL
eukprot:CAMPEP_0181520880 /NCGR_PEP_ID=MMETSP1110-20121109/66550_1 /TAXON_ID=174948 /ORGANISM="Symbiodinium sp., Strain CCMP421" /LENGTH=293 /DNA_ID=CAMNT_0023651407 /DNA_START=38 /DNA_END=920 /DNA_ORIENTATION=-